VIMGCTKNKKIDYEKGFASAKIILNKKGKKVTSKVDTLLNNLTKEQGSSVKDKIKKGLNK